MNITEKKHLKDDYKKICVAEWITLISQTMDLVSDAKTYNHIIFNQYIDQKKMLLNYIEKNEKTSNLIKTIDKTKEELSLGDYAEKALNIKTSNTEKRKLIRDISVLVKDVIEEIHEI
ncbi:hypothetical protein [Treponema putidum]|uniref:Uncharacterized protein n=1 Tax=Treponema putidum TaxID=221027 RepID=A0ABY5HQJ0_9SPIR|nr:hypothetical protein [Treponema putidum]UTY27636.1 hypothetical protein E4N76_00535 [Treponema putidum]